jgi:hypothetical protein
MSIVSRQRVDVETFRLGILNVEKEKWLAERYFMLYTYLLISVF